MGTKGREIVGTDVAGLVKALNKALADEWLAYYQYWVGAIVAKGPARGAVAAELLEHANDELRHAGMLADRIVQLGRDFFSEHKITDQVPHRAGENGVTIQRAGDAVADQIHQIRRVHEEFQGTVLVEDLLSAVGLGQLHGQSIPVVEDFLQGPDHGRDEVGADLFGPGNIRLFSFRSVWSEPRPT